MSESERIFRLEERLAWLQRHVVEQDKAMLAMGDEVARLRQEVKGLRERSGSAGPPSASGIDLDERPPHY